MLTGAVLVLGFSGVVAQTLLLREMLILCSGNELSLCIAISSWVISEALGALSAGAWAGKKAASSGGQARANLTVVFVCATLLFSAAFPASIYAARVFKSIAGLPAETAFGITTALYASFCLLLPTGLLHGFLFSLACALCARSSADTRSPVGKVYLYETLGTIAGGLAASYLFIPHLQAFQTGFGLCLLNGICCLALLRYSYQGKATFASALTALLFVALPGFLLIRGADVLNAASARRAFAGQNLVYYENSFYQNIAVVKTEDQFTFFTDGLPALTTPVPDIVSVEEFVHFSLLAHPSPEHLLFLGGGTGGPIHEALKYPSVRRIDYVELDPALLKTIERFETPLTRSELIDRRVRLHYVDGRRFIRETKELYDIVLLATPSPSTLQKNRLFTEESFALVRRTLKPGGIFVATLPGSLAYYGKELKEINSSVLRSLRAVFPYHYIVPGDINIFLASTLPDISRITPALLFQRLEAARVSTNLVTYAHLTDRFQRERRDWFIAALDNARAVSNHDFRPAALFYQIAYENLMLAPSLQPVLACAERVTFPPAALLVILLSCIVLLIGKRRPRVCLTYTIATTGFVGMALELLLIFGFQVVYGYVFYEIALLITAFMGGIAAGSLLITRRLRERPPMLSMFLSVEAGLMLFTLLVMFPLSIPDMPLLSRPLVLHLLFLLFLFASGIFVGWEFPLATSLYQSTSTLGRSVGLVYAADLAGGCLGGLLTGILLFPLLGLFRACLLLSLLKASSLALLLLQRKRGIIMD